MIQPEALAITYGLSSAISWGAGDFSGGIATQKGNVLTVILYSQLIGAILLAAAIFFLAGPSVSPVAVAWGGMAGICGALGLVALYQGLAAGRMGIVAPLSAVLAALVPMLTAFFMEGPPQLTQMGGFGLGMVAVWFLSAPGKGGRIQKTELVLSLLAGLGFGCYFICIDRASGQSIIWPLMGAKATAVALITGIQVTRGQLARPEPAQVPYIVLTGFLDTAGTTFFALATQLGRLDVSAVLSSMYPAATVVLAWCVLKERLRSRQWFGLAAAIFALGFIAA